MKARVRRATAANALAVASLIGATALARTPVTSILRREVPTVVPATPLAKVGRPLRRRDGRPGAAVPVLESERVVGIVEVAACSPCWRAWTRRRRRHNFTVPSSIGNVAGAIIRVEMES